MTNLPPHTIYDDRIIIDDILLFSNHIKTILHYFSCGVGVFTKYIPSFKLNKCDYFQPRVEYVGHDLPAHSNCSTLSKYNLLQKWSLPPHGISFVFFIGFVTSIIANTSGLKLTLNHCDNYSDFIIAIIFLLSDERNPLFNYSATIN